MNKTHNYAIDFVKFIATLLVINSHMGEAYANYSEFATGGAIGDSLFFFISGFTLFLGSEQSFVQYYKRRLARIYPAILSVGLLSCLFLGNNASFIDIISAKDYWFIKCIFLLYVILYPIKKYGRNIKHTYVLSIILLIVIFLTCFDYSNAGMIYGGGYFRWLLYLVVMIEGALICTNSNDNYHWKYTILLIASVILWYTIMHFYKNNNWQIISIFPLMSINLSLYKIGHSKIVKGCLQHKIWGKVISIIGSLCLESYLIQKMIITDKLNNIFPLNIFIIVLAILIAAYIAQVLAKLIKSIFDSKDIKIDKLFISK